MKRLFSMLITTCILVIMTTNVCAVEYGKELQEVQPKIYEQKFSDVTENHWAYSYISEMVVRGVISGYDDGTFRPDSYITRAEAAKMLAKIEGKYEDNIYDEYGDVKKTDWFAPYVCAVDHYFNTFSDEVGGVEVEFFAPDFVIEREDVVVALVRQRWGNLYSIQNEDISLKFWDYFDISEKKRPYIEKAVNADIITGYSDSTFRPHDGLTRAEMACIMCKLYGCYNTKNFVLNRLSHNFDCTLDEFVQRYNRNLEDNFSKLKKVDEDVISPKAYKIDTSLLKEIDANPYANENAAEQWQRDLFSTCKIYINPINSDMFVCNNGRLVGIDVELPERMRINNSERNELDESKFVYICMVMGAFNIDYDSAFALLCADAFNNNFTVFGNAGISADKNILLFNKYYLLGPYQGILEEKETEDYGSLDVSVNEYVDRYNKAIYDNFKYLTVDVRYVIPEDYLICTDSLNSIETLYKNNSTLNLDVFTYGVGNHLLFCDKRNKILSASIKYETSARNKKVNKLDPYDLQNIAVIMACDASLSFEEAKENYFVVANGNSVSTDTCLIDGYLDVFSKKFYNLIAK